MTVYFYWSLYIMQFERNESTLNADKFERGAYNESVSASEENCHM